GKPVLGIGAGSYQLPSDCPGGEYVLRMTEKDERFPPIERKILVTAGPAPQPDKQLRFTRVSYAPGDEVRFEGTIKRGNQPWTGAVEARVQIDGKHYDA